MHDSRRRKISIFLDTEFIYCQQALINIIVENSAVNSIILRRTLATSAALAGPPASENV